MTPDRSRAIAGHSQGAVLAQSSSDFLTRPLLAQDSQSPVDSPGTADSTRVAGGIAEAGGIVKLQAHHGSTASGGHLPRGAGTGGHHSAFPGASVTSAVFNLTTTSVGAGIMALPATMKVLGVPLGLAAILFLGWLTDFALRIIVRTSISGGHRSYGQLMGASCGGWGRFLAQLFVFLQALGSLVVYLIITGDVLSGSTMRTPEGVIHHTGILEEWAGGPTWWNARFPVLLMVLLFIVVPLASLSRIDSLMASSALSVALAVAFVVFTIGTSILRLNQGGLPPPRLFPDLTTWPSILQTFTTLPVMANAFICHYNVQPIYEELEEQTEKAMKRVAHVSQFIVTSIYCGAATSSYLLFGEATASDVLANFDQSFADLGVPKVACDMVRLGYVLHLLLVFPIVHFPLRLTLDVMLFPRASRPLALDRPRFAALTSALLGAIFFCAIVIPDIYVLFAILGAVVSVSIGFTFPAIIALRSTSCSFGPWESAAAWFMLALGAYLTISGIIADSALL